MILFGNTFPPSLIRRPIYFQPKSLPELIKAAENGVLSFWGHDDTRHVAAEFLGFDPIPPHHRPAIRLNDEFYPTLDGQVFHEVWLLSPDFRPGFRPALGEAVTPEKIIDWQVLHLTFP